MEMERSGAERMISEGSLAPVIRLRSSQDREEARRQTELIEMVESGIFQTQLALICEGVLSPKRVDYLRNEIPSAVKGGESVERALYDLALLWLSEYFLAQKDHEAIEREEGERAKRNLREFFDKDALEEARQYLAAGGVVEPR